MVIALFIEQTWRRMCGIGLNIGHPSAFLFGWHMYSFEKQPRGAVCGSISFAFPILMFKLGLVSLILPAMILDHAGVDGVTNDLGSAKRGGMAKISPGAPKSTPKTAGTLTARGLSQELAYKLRHMFKSGTQG